jgi:hypothetical protein
MKKYFVYLMVLALFTSAIFAIDMEKLRFVRKTGWPLPDFKKYRKSEIKIFKIEGIPEQFMIQFYDLKDKYKDELFQIEMKLDTETEMRKYTLTGYGIIKLIKNNKEIVIAYDYLPLFDIGDLVYEEGYPDDKFYTGGAAWPIIITDLDKDGIYESLYGLLEQDEKGFFIDMRKEVTKYKYKKMMEKKGLKKKSLIKQFFESVRFSV